MIELIIATVGTRNATFLLCCSNFRDSRVRPRAVVSRSTERSGCQLRGSSLTGKRTNLGGDLYFRNESAIGEPSLTPVFSDALLPLTYPLGVLEMGTGFNARRHEKGRGILHRPAHLQWC